MEAEWFEKVVAAVMGTGGAGAILAVAVRYLMGQLEMKDNKRETERQQSYLESTAREERLVTALQHQTSWVQSELVDLITSTKGVITDNTAALREFSDAVRTRPCLKDGDH